MVTRINDLFETFQRYQSAYSGEEDDEKLVYLAVGKIESMLDAVLRNYLLESGDEEDPLLDEGRALSSFGVKIQLCRRLGLISKKLSEDLHFLRRIRKQFKNYIDCTSLSSQNVRHFCANLHAPAQLRNRLEELKNAFPENPRGDFELAVTIVSALLDSILSQVGRTTNSPLH